MSEIDRNLLGQISMGMDGEAFVNTDLGRAILERCAVEAIEAVEGLKSIRPGDYDSLEQFAEAVRDLQVKVYRAEGFEQWLMEIIDNGRNTEQIMVQSQQEDGDFDNE